MTTLNRRDFLALLGSLGLAACSRRILNSSNAKVVVIGGGYGGATAARYLKLLAPTLDVTLIDKDPVYFSCAGSNEVVAAWHDLGWLRRSHQPLADGYGIRIVHERVIDVDSSGKTIRLQGGAELPYDRLILSPGIDLRWDAIEGYDYKASLVAPHAWKAGPQTLLLRSKIASMRAGGVVMITSPASPYRCPPGPYERASLIAHYLARHNPRAKVIILDAKTQFSKQALFLKGWQDLYPGRVEWLSSEKEGQIDHIDAVNRTVVTEFNKHQADVLNVIPPQQAGELAQKTGLTDASGWCPVDPISFESTLQPKIHVIGDACIATPMPKSAFAANSQAKICAAAIVALLEERAPGMPSLINHCYSFLAPDYAISINGVYEYARATKELFATGGGETPMTADRRREADFARDWQQHITADTFL